jgi:hypothetical protein
MSHKESKSNNNNDKEEWFGGYKGGMLRWNTMKKRSRYARRYKDSEVMRRILSTRIDP